MSGDGNQSSKGGEAKPAGAGPQEKSAAPGSSKPPLPKARRKKRATLMGLAPAGASPAKPTDRAAPIRVPAAERRGTPTLGSGASPHAAPARPAPSTSARSPGPPPPLAKASAAQPTRAGNASAQSAGPATPKSPGVGQAAAATSPRAAAAARAPASPSSALPVEPSALHEPAISHGRPPALSLPPPPAVLVVGSGYAHTDELLLALSRTGLHVDTTDKKRLGHVVVAMAPDLVLLVGDATEESGREVVRALNASKLTSTVPVVLLAADARLNTRLSAFRHGVTAVVAEDAGIDGVAAEVAQLAQDIPERDGVVRGRTGAAMLGDLVDLLGEELKSGILSVRAPGAAEHEKFKLVLGEGRPIAQLIDEFVRRLSKHVVAAEPVDFEFEELPPGSVRLVGPDSERQPTPEEVGGMRIVLADDDPERADAVAQALRATGTTVVVSSLDPQGHRLERLRALDPAVLVMGEETLHGAGYELVKRMRGDTRLRWASLLVPRWGEVWPPDADTPNIEPIADALAALGEPERSVAARAEETAAFDTRLEIAGPARLLRALARATHPLRVMINNPRVSFRIDLHEGMVAGASGATTSKPPAELEGLGALSGLLVLSSGRMRVMHVNAPSEGNVMRPVESALNLAAAQEPPIRPSAPAPAGLGALPEALAAEIPRAPRVPGQAGDAASAAAFGLADAVDDGPDEAPTTQMPSLASPLPEYGAPPPFEPQPVEALPLAELQGPPSTTPVPASASLTPPYGEAKSRKGLWIGLVAALALGIGVLAVVLTRPPEEQPVAAQPPPAPAPAPEPAPTPSAEPAPSPTLSLADRAAAGDAEAMRQLEAKPPEQRSAAESLALARGRQAQRIADLARLRSELGAEPELAKQGEVLGKLRGYVQDPVTAPEALRILAELDEPAAADILYAAWIGTSERNDTTRLAEELVSSAGVREHASDALKVAIDLRKAEECEEYKALLPTAIEHGDRRSLRPLALLLRRRGCGKKKLDDCYKCIRKDKRFNKAIRVARNRKAPRLPAVVAPDGDATEGEQQEQD